MERFEDFMFQVSHDEWESLRFQIGTSNKTRGGMDMRYAGKHLMAIICLSLILAGCAKPGQGEDIAAVSHDRQALPVRPAFTSAMFYDEAVKKAAARIVKKKPEELTENDIALCGQARFLVVRGVVHDFKDILSCYLSHPFFAA